MPLAIAELSRLWRTVRWLRAEQVLGRLRMHLPRPAADLRPAPPLRAPSGPWVTPPRRAPSMTGPTRMAFLDEERDLQRDGWDHPDVPLLWRYNLHYFDDLNAHDASTRSQWHGALVQRWIEQNPPGAGTGWAPYPTSLRIVNWIKWFRSGADAARTWHDHLAVQVRWLAHRLEWHLLGNHLFANAKALTFAGCHFDGPEAAAWHATGVRIIERELPEQVLGDGGHFERSPMYHALALEDVLDLINAFTAWPPSDPAGHHVMDTLRNAACRMLDWCRVMRHPDGTLPRFNDCADGIAPPFQEIERYAAALGISAASDDAEGVRHLADSGYLRVRCGPATAFIDAAPIGPDYLPGHAHADTLSFELSLGGRQLVVNRGTSEYGSGPRRQYERGSAAHSTVQIGHHDSSEVWAGFRVGRRARPGPLVLDGLRIHGSHDGYTHLPGSPRHHRSWHFDAKGVTVVDAVDPSPREPAVARFHLAPGLALAPAGPQAWHVIGDTGLARVDVTTGHGESSLTRHALRFGRLADAATLEVRLLDGRSAVRFSWNDPCTSSS